MKSMTSTSDQKPEFLFANCEQCHGIIRIPITVRPDSSVSCPHCENQFQLSSVLDQQVPEIQMLDGSSPPTHNITVKDVEIDTGTAIKQQDGKFVVPSQLAAGIKKRKRRRRKSSSERSAEPVSPANGSTRQLSEADELRIARREDRTNRERDKLQQQRNASAARARGELPKGPARGSSRRKSSKRSPVIEVFKIAVGGMLAIPIAYLLLMWMFSRDPLSLAPTIYDYAPGLVPGALVLDESDPVEIPAIGDTDEFNSDSLPIPDTDPDDIDSGMIDFNL